MTTRAAAPSEIWLALPAVIVPSGEKAGFSLASDSTVVSGRTPSSVSTTRGSPLRCGTFTGVISSAKRCSLIAAAARSCELAEKLSCRSRLRPAVVGVALGRGSHRNLVEGAEQAVVHHRVDDLLVAEPVAGASAGQQVGRSRHRLHPAGDDDVGLAGADGEVGEMEGVEAREADLVDGGRRHASSGCRP